MPRNCGETPEHLSSYVVKVEIRLKGAQESSVLAWWLLQWIATVKTACVPASGGAGSGRLIFYFPWLPCVLYETLVLHPRSALFFLLFFFPRSSLSNNWQVSNSSWHIFFVLLSHQSELNKKPYWPFLPNCFSVTPQKNSSFIPLTQDQCLLLLTP